MSVEREVTVIKPDGSTTTRQVTTEDKKRAEEYQRKQARKAVFARVRERGFTVDRLTVDDLPPDIHGEWVLNDPVEIARKQGLGYKVDTEFATKRALHNDGSGKAIVGDVIFMTCSREDYEIYTELCREQFVRMHGSPDEKAALKQAEEAEFAANMAVLGGDIPMLTSPKDAKSEARTVRADEIAATLKAGRT